MISFFYFSLYVTLTFSSLAISIAIQIQLNIHIQFETLHLKLILFLIPTWAPTDTQIERKKTYKNGALDFPSGHLSKFIKSGSILLHQSKDDKVKEIFLH